MSEYTENDYREMMAEDLEENKELFTAPQIPDSINAKQSVQDAEYNLVEALLEAADYQSDIVNAEIRRKGKLLFTVHIRPIGDKETRKARKKATTMLPNPNGRKLPKIEGEFDPELFNSWLIYLATTEEDKKQIWGNKQVMDKYDILQPVEMIDILLRSGEKGHLVDLVAEISGMDEESDTLEEYAKN